MGKLKLGSPWQEFGKKLNALFGKDPDITVGEVYKIDDGETDYGIDIEVRSHRKAVALDRVLPKKREFGLVTLGITVFDEENANGGADAVQIYSDVFDGNPLVEGIEEADDFTGAHHGYVLFKPEVVQFFNDDLGDLNGNWNGLAQDIAREVFRDECRGIHFCTTPINGSGE